MLAFRAQNEEKGRGTFASRATDGEALLETESVRTSAAWFTYSRPLSRCFPTVSKVPIDINAHAILVNRPAIFPPQSVLQIKCFVIATWDSSLLNCCECINVSCKARNVASHGDFRKKSEDSPSGLTTGTTTQSTFLSISRLSADFSMSWWSK